MNKYRFVVCIDVSGKDLDDAYHNLSKFFAGTEQILNGDVNWESTSEVYTPDGEAVDEEEVALIGLTTCVCDECGAVYFEHEELNEQAHNEWCSLYNIGE